MKLTTGHFTLARVEVVGNGIDTCRVTNKDDAVCKLFGFQMKVEAGSVIIDDKLRVWEMFFCHSIICF
jgi:hypothetical protein